MRTYTYETKLLTYHVINSCCGILKKKQSNIYKIGRLQQDDSLSYSFVFNLGFKHYISTLHVYADITVAIPLPVQIQ